MTGPVGYIKDLFYADSLKWVDFNVIKLTVLQLDLQIRKYEPMPLLWRRGHIDGLNARLFRQSIQDILQNVFFIICQPDH